MEELVFYAWVQLATRIRARPVLRSSPHSASALRANAGKVTYPRRSQPQTGPAHQGDSGDRDRLGLNPIWFPERHVFSAEAPARSAIPRGETENLGSALWRRGEWS